MPFKIEAFQNRHLSAGASRVDAIVSLTAPGVPSASAKSAELVIGFIIDRSGSMEGERIAAVKSAVALAIDVLDPRTWFFVVAFDARAEVVIPPMQGATANKAQVARALAAIQASGGTAMSMGLAAAREVFARAPNAIRQAVFLTDGKNEGETHDQVLAQLQQCVGVFECDGWGVGTDWQVAEVQTIAQGLLGKASLIPDPTGIVAAFRGAMEKAGAKAFKDVRLRMWTPQGAQVVFVKQVNPTIEELTHKARALTPQVREFATGAWGPGESRDFHVAIDVKVGKVGDEMLAARPSVAYAASEAGGWVEHEDKSPEARLLATWTSDDALSSRIDHQVAHYTGQDELASAIVEGLHAREQGNEAAATQLLGRAVQIAHQSHNAEMTHRLSKVVEVIEPATGTVKLKRDVKKAAAMDLQLESRTTKRVARGPAPGGSGGT